LDFLATFLVAFFATFFLATFFAFFFAAIGLPPSVSLRSQFMFMLDRALQRVKECARCRQGRDDVTRIIHDLLLL
jgi:hypothetical protein